MFSDSQIKRMVFSILVRAFMPLGSACDVICMNSIPYLIVVAVLGHAPPKVLIVFEF